MLTVIGYSVMDTIVILDRIRENTKLMAGEPFDKIVNTSILQTMTRSVNTLATVVITLVALLAFGGASLQNFAFALLVGICSGGYHSIFYSAPLVAVVPEALRAQRGAAPRLARAQPRTVAEARAQAKQRRRPGRDPRRPQGAARNATGQSPQRGATGPPPKLSPPHPRDHAGGRRASSRRSPKRSTRSRHSIRSTRKQLGLTSAITSSATKRFTLNLDAADAPTNPTGAARNAARRLSLPPPTASEAAFERCSRASAPSRPRRGPRGSRGCRTAPRRADGARRFSTSSTRKRDEFLEPRPLRVASATPTASTPRSSA